MEIKFLGSMITVFAASAIGYMLGEKAKDQLKIMESLRRCMTIFRGEIQYSGTPLREVFELLVKYKHEIWCEFFEKMANEMGSSTLRKNMGQMWKESLTTTSFFREMSTVDRMECIRFGEALGSYDKGSQVGQIDLYMEQVNNRITELEGAISERVRLYRLLGVAGGVFITILMV